MHNVSEGSRLCIFEGSGVNRPSVASRIIVLVLDFSLELGLLALRSIAIF